MRGHGRGAQLFIPESVLVASNIPVDQEAEIDVDADKNILIKKLGFMFYIILRIRPMIFFIG